ncbi:putative transcription factor C2H2 family [Helianthus annuus]|uniref:Putative zinc finger, RING/FYVE/PHD-type n=1 Tax=Helianthus annuus TaxID=4232 RepID=A0A251VHG2_HELAN|nr:putative transcription factor C2H2 family [Helianthus annuus]KAJ0604754.1 putative transcription factor C2H2 family [Helianthus annuus]KAJ0618768.1 putative transcription factor C2H2 family [Helianthus annuus]KAJ0939934.1 putative transcription factor C2H2 family [Helianthus annuus]KAJ0953896.1 putative transcription factor C2H2 family [Helianthus annuus]
MSADSPMMSQMADDGHQQLIGALWASSALMTFLVFMFLLDYFCQNRTIGLPVLKSPSPSLFIYYANPPECAVCLSEFENGETCRVLPICKHCFHDDCIDTWFYNNSTCPLCRSKVLSVRT